MCEGSLVADRGVLYFSHPQSETTRTNLTIHRSEDNGTIESFCGECVCADPFAASGLKGFAVLAV